MTMEKPLIESHRAAGARIAEYSGVALPEAYAELEREYVAARESVALFDTNWHAFLALTGRDRVKYLHAISSNNIQALENGQGTLALLLNPSTPPERIATILIVLAGVVATLTWQWPRLAGLYDSILHSRSSPASQPRHR